MDEQTRNMYYQITIKRWGGNAIMLAKAFYQGKLCQNEIDIAKAFLDDRDFDAGRILAIPNFKIDIDNHIIVSVVNNM